MVVAFCVLARQNVIARTRLEPRAQAWLERLPAASSGTPVAVRLRTMADCGCETAEWTRLAEAVDELGGLALVLPVADAPQPGLEVAILGADGRLRYAGALAPDSDICGEHSLASWLPGLLPERAPLYLPASANCAC